MQMKKRRLAEYVLMAVLALLTIFVALFCVFVMDYRIEDSEIQEILDKINDPKQERAGHLELREWVESHPYDSRILGLALIEEKVDKQYCVDVIERYIEGNPDDFDARFVVFDKFEDPRESLKHVDYVLNHASPEKFRRYSIFVRIKKRYLAQIASEATQELSIETIKSATQAVTPAMSE